MQLEPPPGIDDRRDEIREQLRGTPVYGTLRPVKRRPDPELPQPHSKAQLLGMVALRGLVGMVGLAVAGTAALALVGLIWVASGAYMARSAAWEARLAEESLHASLPGSSQAALAELQRLGASVTEIREAHRTYLDRPQLDTALTLMERYDHALATAAVSADVSSVTTRLGPAARAFRTWELEAVDWRDATTSGAGRLAVLAGLVPAPPADP